MKFKVGDIIKGKLNNGYRITNKKMTKGKVIETFDEYMRIKVLEHENKDNIEYTTDVKNSDKCFELVHSKKPTKQELLDMPVGTKIYTDAKDKDYQEYVKKFNKNFEGKETTILYGEINNDLTITDNRCGTKIIKIEEPTYETVYEYEEEPKEMTIAEIERKLKENGYSIKIIKED